MVATHEPLEDEADQQKRRIIDTGRRRHRSDSGKEYGNVDITPVGQREPAGEVVEWDGKDGANEEEPQDWVIDCPRTEQSLRSNASPYQ